jgi:hypothetical protein
MELKESLDQAGPVIMECAIEASEAMLQKRTFTIGTVVYSERLANSHRYFCSLGAANPRFQGLFTVGIDTRDAEDLLADAVQEDVVLDILGELANNICGACCSRKAFVTIFGVLVQAPPVASDGGAFYFPRADSIAGDISLGMSRLTVGFAIRQAGTSSVQFKRPT